MMDGTMKTPFGLRRSFLTQAKEAHSILPAALSLSTMRIA
jgi:hypothetical protein